MSDGDRGKRSQDLITAGLCAVALFGTVVVAYAVGVTLGVGSGRDQVTAREHYESAKQDNLSACAGRERAATIECVAKAVESAQEQSDSRQDLYAQQDMSRWAFWMLLASVATFLVTAVGVWFVKRTLDATLEAVEDTGKGTRAMERQNDIAERSSERQLRAYFGFDGAFIQLPPHRPLLHVQFKNFGQTPALEVTLTCSMTVVLTKTMSLHDSIGPELHSIDVPPSQVMSRNFTLPKEIIPNLESIIEEENARLNARLVLKYRDIYGAGHKVVYILTSSPDQFILGIAGIEVQSDEEDY